MATDVSILNRQIALAERNLVEQRSSESGDDDTIAVLFTGNWQDSSPRRLTLCRDLSPVDKIAWQVIRLTITDPSRPGSTPKRDELAAMINCSEPTVTTSRQMLRICRWMTHCKSVRKQGRFVGEIYLLNDEPLSIESTLELDHQYVHFLETIAESTSAKRLRTAAAQALKEVGSLNSVDVPNELSALGHRVFSSMNLTPHQSKNFAAVEDAKTVDIPTTPIESRPETSQSKNFAAVESHQSKIFSTVEKNFFSRSSSSFNNNNLNNTNTRARDKAASHQEPEAIDEFRDVMDIGRWGNAQATPKALLSGISKRLANPILSRYTDWLFAGKASSIAVISRKLKGLPIAVQEMIIFQLLGREASHLHGWTEISVRNPVGYVSELVVRYHRGEFNPDEWALELFRASMDGLEPQFKDSPEKQLALERKAQGSSAY